MPAKKKDTKEHVTLSQETVAKLMNTAKTAHEPVMISPWHLLELERSEHNAKMMQMTLRLRKAEDLARKFASELSAKQAEQDVQEATRAFQQSGQAHDKLAALIADRYHFSWSTHSYNPETGEVLESSPES